jgi:hypothetical protein
MTITLEIRPEVQAELARQAAIAGRALEAHAATVLEGAIHMPAAGEPNETSKRTGPDLVAECAKVRGSLTAEEIDTLFSRNPSAPALAPIEPGFGRRLVEAFAPVRGLLSEEEVDTIFRREPALDRPLEL